jgi:hypothetical protein
MLKKLEDGRWLREPSTVTLKISGLCGPDLERVVVEILPDANFDPATLSSVPPPHGDGGFATRTEWRERQSLFPGD